MSTATVLIGNSDDKLTQEKWSAFCDSVGWLISRYGGRPHFSGYSVGSAPWQNACWVFDIPDEPSSILLRFELGRLAAIYRQDSIALLVGETEFVKALDTKNDRAPSPPQCSRKVSHEAHRWGENDKWYCRGLSYERTGRA